MGLGVAITSMAACSTQPDTATTTHPIDVLGPAAPRAGQIHVRLTLAGTTFLPNGATIATVNYSISGPTSTSGSVDVSHSQAIEFVVGDLAVGPGYTITLSANDSAGDSCSSNATPFSISAGQTSQVGVNLVCYVVNDAGTVMDAAPADADADAMDSSTPDATGCADQTNCNAFVSANRSSFLLTDNGVCTATELTLYAKAVSGQSTGSCLACAATGSCLDDSFDASDVLHECEDAPTTTDAGGAGVTECLATLACDLGVSGSCGSFASIPAPSQGTTSASYCGPGVTNANCTASPTPTDAGTGPQGACVAQEAAGFPSGFTPAQVLTAFVDTSLPSGLANHLVACLNAKCAAQCFP
jgi:hypothetical protein